MKTIVYISLAVSIGALAVGCGGGGGSTATTTTTPTSAKATYVVTGTVPGTQIEAFCNDGSYHTVKSIQNGTAQHPFTLELPSNVGCRLAMTTNEDDPANRVITPISMSRAGSSSTTFTSDGSDLPLGHIPLAMSRAAMHTDANSDGVEDNPLEHDLSTAPAGVKHVDMSANDPLDTDHDGVMNIHEDTDGDGTPNSHDLDDDGDTINDTSDTDHDNDGQNDNDADHDGIKDAQDTDRNNDGVKENPDSPANKTTYSVVGKVPGTLIEAFCTDGSYHAVKSIKDGTAQHPFILELPQEVGCRLVMTTNEDDPANRIITPVSMSRSGSSSTTFTSDGSVLDLGYIPLAMSRTKMHADDNGDGVEDRPLEHDLSTAPAGVKHVDMSANDPLDTDHDGVMNIHEDSDGDGTPNSHDLDDDNDGIHDTSDTDHNNDGQDDNDTDHDGIKDNHDTDRNNDGKHD